MFQLRGAAGAGSVMDSCYFMDCVRVRLRLLSLEYVSFEFCTFGLKLYIARPDWVSQFSQPQTTAFYILMDERLCFKSCINFRLENCGWCLVVCLTIGT